MVAIPLVSSTATFAEANQIIGTLNTYGNTLAGLLAPAGVGSMAGAINLPAASSQVNLLSITGGATGTGPTIVPGGPNAGTQVNLILGGIGTGTLQIANSGAFSANGTVAATFTVTSAPSGARTAIQKWLTVADQSGTIFFNPLW